MSNDKLRELLAGYPVWLRPSVAAAWHCGYDEGIAETALISLGMIVDKMYEQGSSREDVVAFFSGDGWKMAREAAEALAENPGYMRRRLKAKGEPGVADLPEEERIPALEHLVKAKAEQLASRWETILTNLEEMGSSPVAIRQIARERHVREDEVEAFAEAPDAVRSIAERLRADGLGVVEDDGEDDAL